MLRFVLLDELPEEDVPTTLFEGVEAVTEVEEGTALTITVQKRIEGITVTSRTLDLTYRSLTLRTATARSNHSQVH